MQGASRHSSSFTRRLLCAQSTQAECAAITRLFDSYVVDCSTNAITAQQWVAERYYDLYLLDDELEGGTGLTVLSAIRRVDPHGPVLMCYAHATHTAAGVEAMSSGAHAFLVKPVDLMFIENAVKGLISMARMRNIGAKIAERQAVIDAIDQNLRAMQNARDAVRAQLLRAQEALARAKAWLAFSMAGGTRASFETLWPEVYSTCKERPIAPVRAN